MLFSGNWEYWELGHKVTFYPLERWIVVNDGVTDIDIKIDIYSDNKEWLLATGNSKYPPACRAAGGDPIPGGVTGSTFFLINGWKLVLDLTKVRVNGVLFSDDFDTPFYTTGLEPVFPATVSSLVNQTVTRENVVTGDVNTIPAAVWDVILSPTPPPGSAAEVHLRIQALVKAILGFTA